MATQMLSSQSNAGKFIDHNPELQTAGKVFANYGSVPECIEAYNPGKPDSPPVVRRFRETLEPAPGATTRHYGKADDVETGMVGGMTHGKQSLNADGTVRDCVNPDPKTLFAQKLQDKQSAVYSSHNTKPLGSWPDPTRGLPEGTDVYSVVYGRPLDRDEPAGNVINPRKTAAEVQAESLEGRPLYIKSHLAYHPGEQATRGYENWDKTGTCGYPTPNNERGVHVKAAMYWQAQRKMDAGAIVTGKTLDDHREKYTDQVGQTRDPIKDTMSHLPEDHTFGIVVKPDDHGVDDILHGRGPKHFLRGKDKERAVLAAVRLQLKNGNFNRFDDVAAALKHLDPDGTGCVSTSALRNLCTDYAIPLDDVILEQLLDLCRTEAGEAVDYARFAQFLYWQPVKPDSQGQREHVALTGDTPRRIENQLDQALGGYRTSAAQVNAAVGRVPSQTAYRSYGIPSIRNDKPGPPMKRVSDRTNYGDEADAWGLVTPSVFSNKGVHEDDLFKERSPQEIRSIFRAIGEDFADDVFLDVFNHAASLHPEGRVNLECFRASLNKMAAPS